jgi:hypothetical protein
VVISVPTNGIPKSRAKVIEIYAAPPQDEGHGITVALGVPGGAEFTRYEPRHKTAIPWPNKTRF